MKKIIAYLRDYLKDEFHPFTFGFTFIFLGTCIWINYSWNFERGIIEGLHNSPWKIGAYFLFYTFPWLTILFVQQRVKGKTGFPGTPEFWFAFLVGVFALSFSSWFYFHYDVAAWLADGREERYIRKIGWNIKQSLLYGTPLFLYWKFRDKGMESFYGFTFKRFDWKPYAFMLGVVIPGIIWASFQPDFLRTYPTYRPSLQHPAYGMPSWLEMGIYELFYGVDFAVVELLFRGFLVIGLAKWLGKEAILPMVGMYCFLHFGKPMVEAISSCFGGLILGVIAYETRTILGGIAIHMGVGISMDIAAYIQTYMVNQH